MNEMKRKDLYAYVDPELKKVAVSTAITASILPATLFVLSILDVF